MGRGWVNANFQVVSTSCQSMLGAPELCSLRLLLDMENGNLLNTTVQGTQVISEISQTTSNIYTVLPEPMVEKHVIQTCALDGSVSTMLSVDGDPELEKLTRKFPELFTEGVGIYSGDSHTIRLKPDAVPTRSRMREAPQAYAQLASDKIESMLKDGLCERTKASNWVSPVHYVKKDGKCIRVTVDYSTGLNKAIIPVSHPLPRPS
ncbi:MAG: hypothetical protein GY799_09000, partial [Desulfobulbaceae bacterium]|nr:hypothetical protein [Desulfobulbaceae bacterium]